MIAGALAAIAGIALAMFPAPGLEPATSAVALFPRVEARSLKAQRRGEMYSGIRGIAIQDSSLQESMGPIVDRTKERLVPADSGIIKARQKLRKAAIALRDEGVTPPGVDPRHHRIRSAAVVLPQAESFLDSCRDAVKAVPGTPQSTV